MQKSPTSYKGSKQPRQPVVSSRPQPVQTKEDIVNLSYVQICQLSRDELIALIRLADVPFLQRGAKQHLPYSDRDTLQRLAFLAQRTLRNQGGHNDRPEN